ncbi:MAG TPA: MFS transporter [Solirubrobacterales bacterium]|nr:MFS transporter [Solirubrobacterales bacterium]
MPDLARYRPLVAEPGFREQGLAGFFAQLSQGGAVLALILLIQQTRGSLGLAGAATAGFVIGAAIARPIQGRLIDRIGPRRVLLLIALGHTAALLALAPIARSDLAGIAAVAVSLVAGLGLPPVSQTQRLIWADLAGEDRTTVYSVIGMIQEGSILAGPLLVGVVAGVASPSAALIAVALISGLGLAWLGLSVPSGRRVSAGGRVGDPLRVHGVRLVLLLEFLFGIALGGIEIGVPALAAGEGHPSVSGFLLAVTSVGGIAGALVYGARSWASSPRARLVLLLALSAVGFAFLVPVESLVVAGAVLLVLGSVLTPVLTTLIVLLDLASPRFAAEAFGWSSTSSAIGSGAGAAVIGVLAQHHGAGPAFAIAGAGCALALLVAAGARGLPGTGQPASPG